MRIICIYKRNLPDSALHLKYDWTHHGRTPGAKSTPWCYHSDNSNTPLLQSRHLESPIQSMSLILYHSVESTCAQKVRIVLAAKDLDWLEIRLNLRKGEQFSPQYLRLNPKAVVPTLVHDGAAIRESSVINEYLEDRFPDTRLRPTDALACAQMRLLVKTIDEEVHPAIGVLSYAVFLRHQMNERMSVAELREHFSKVADPARRERQQSTHERGLSAPAALMAVRTLARFVVQLSAALGERSWLAGDDFTLADAAALPIHGQGACAAAVTTVGCPRQRGAVAGSRGKGSVALAINRYFRFAVLSCHGGRLCRRG